MNDQQSEMKLSGGARRDGFAAVAMFVLAVGFVLWIAFNLL